VLTIIAPVQTGADPDDAGQAAPAEDHIVERVVFAAHFADTLPVIALHPHPDHQPFFHPIVAIQHLAQGFLPVVGEDLGQKAQPPHFDAEHRNFHFCTHAGSAQHCAVATQGNQQVYVVQAALDSVGIPGRVPPDVGNVPAG
jgi:hypothetical protein